MTINEEILKKVRREFHANPEVSENEVETQKRILRYLDQWGVEETRAIGNLGVLATFRGSEVGPSVMIRGDIDALPIQEVNDFEHRSKVDGVSHKCGHDGHTTILLGLAANLAKNPPKSGTAYLLFQPAEENGMGAQGVIDDEDFQQLDMDYVFALHNLPGFKKHEIVVKSQEFTSNVKSMIIKLHGKTAHAAEPEKGHNPALAIANILRFSEEQTKNDPSAADFFLITPIHVHMGELAYGISAGYGEVHLTIRSWSTALMKQKDEALVTFINHVAKNHHLNAEISYTQVFHANINDESAVQKIKMAAKENGLELTETNQPFKWGEDFGLFTQKFKGAMFGLGAGKETPALHNPDYDFPDEITSTGIRMFESIIHQILN